MAPHLGPDQIEPELYCQELKRIRELESGDVRYKANDVGYPTYGPPRR